MSEHVPSRRLVPAAVRRIRLLYIRCRYPKISFGRNCDVRRGFWAVLGPSPIVRFGRRCVIDRHMNIEVHGRLSVGDRTIFGHHCTIAVHDSVEIGEDCLIAEMVSIRDHDHRTDDLQIPVRQQGMNVAGVRIGKNVWIGCKVTVKRGITIGDNAVIGANAVVTRDIPSNAVAVGVPAKVIRFRQASSNTGSCDAESTIPSRISHPL